MVQFNSAENHDCFLNFLGASQNHHLLGMNRLPRRSLFDWYFASG